MKMTEAIVESEAAIVGARVVIASTKDALQKALCEGSVVLLRNLLIPQKVLQLRRLVSEWGAQTPALDFGQDANVPRLNFHRIDRAAAKSGLPHIFHQYGFGDLTALPYPLALILSEVANPLLDLQNQLAGTKFQMEDEEVRIKFLQYVRGGGFLALHEHPLLPQKVGLILGLSTPGEDFNKGGLCLQTPFGPVDCSVRQQCGDLILFRYDLPHEVTPIDNEVKPDWSAKNGRWVMVLELLSTYGQSRLSGA